MELDRASDHASEVVTIDSLLDVLLERVFDALDNPSSACIKETEQIPSLLRWLTAHPHNAITSLNLQHRFMLCDVGSDAYSVLEALPPGQLHTLCANVNRILAAPWDRFMSLRVLKVHSESKPQQFLNQVAQLPALEVLLYHNGHFRTTSAVVLPPPLIERGMLRCLDLHFHAHELDLYGTDLAPMASSLTELRLTNAMAYPSNLSTLTSLETLAITQVSEFIPILPPLPAGLSELTSLSSLIIEGAAFADGYPHCVQSMKQLTQLVLRGEWGVIVPPIEGLRQLKWLEVCTGILDAQSLAPLSQCTSLSVLLLGRCCLAAVPEQVARLAGLQELELAFNHLTKRLPGGVYLHDLRVLDLSHNRLTVIPRVLANATKLKQLYVHHQETQIALMDDESYAVVAQLSELERIAVISDGDTPIKLKPRRHLNDYWLPTDFEANVQRLQERGVLVT